MEDTIESKNRKNDTKRKGYKEKRRKKDKDKAVWIDKQKHRVEHDRRVKTTV